MPLSSVWRFCFHLFSLVSLRLLPDIAENHSRSEDDHIRGRKQNQNNQETIRPPPRLIIRAAPPNLVWLGPLTMFGLAWHAWYTLHGMACMACHPFMRCVHGIHAWHACMPCMPCMAFMLGMHACMACIACMVCHGWYAMHGMHGIPCMHSTPCMACNIHGMDGVHAAHGLPCIHACVHAFMACHTCMPLRTSRSEPTTTTNC